jgi:DNA-binding response OmpR family regulator
MICEASDPSGHRRPRMHRTSRIRLERGLDTSSVILFASSDEWMSRSIGTVFEDRGFAVVRAASGTLALNIARRSRPDVVLLDDAPAGLDAVSVCRALRDDPLFDPSTPVVITSSAHLGSSTRTAAYEAGAWEYCSQPVDVEQLVLKIRTFLRSRHELTQSRSQRCLDAMTGLYTPHGMEQVAYQLRARAARDGESLACLTLAPERVMDDGAGVTAYEDARHAADLANICRLHSRRSDFVGHAGPTRVAILAPDTDAAGARALAARLERSFDDVSRQGAMAAEYRVRAGYCSIADSRGAKIEPADLIARAAAALEQLQRGDSSEFVLGFEQLSSA